MPKVAVIMGSKSDLKKVEPCFEMLEYLGIDYQQYTISAHRQPEQAREFGLTAREGGFELIIAAAGKAAHLPGVIASWTTLPVIGIPIASGELKGKDALYSIVQMPSGIPVATVAIDGAKNAAFLAAEILGLKYPKINAAYDKYRQSLQGEAL
jgi:5-(carboxyamino)imidazole ribonucleotide mutase